MKPLARILVSVIALAAASAKTFLPNANVDINTTILLLIALLPWLTNIIEVAELPGGWKFKFRSLKEAAEKGDGFAQSGTELRNGERKKYVFELVGLSDPNLALAGLRIEIERRLKLLATRAKIDPRMNSISSLLNSLSFEGVISQQERSVIDDLNALLNSAVHGARIDRESANWALDFGIELLKSLDSRLYKKSARKPSPKRGTT